MNDNNTAPKISLAAKVMIGYLNADEVKGTGTKMDKAKAIGKCALYGAAISTASFAISYGVSRLIMAGRDN